MKARSIRQVLVWLPALGFGLATGFWAGAASSPSSQPGISGPFSFSFTNLSVPVFDLSGSYRFEHAVTVAGGMPTTLSLPCSLEQDASGRLRGSGVTNIQMGSNVFQAQYTVNGKVTGGARKAARAMMSVRWSAQGAEPIAISVQYSLVVSPGFLDGVARGRAKIGRGTGPISSGIGDLPLPAGADGNWSVQMNLKPPTGSGSIVLPRDRKLQATAAVTFSRQNGSERVRLVGAGMDRGTTLNLSFDPKSGVLGTLSGKVLGQTVTLVSRATVTASQVASAATASSAYAGYQACLECHTPVQQTLQFTRHAQVGVECESCHGPAANHAANDYDPVSRPTIPYDGKSCGACHDGPRHPIYTEWKASGHAQVAIDLSPADRTSSCGRCHSGSVRVNLLDGTPPPVEANVPLGCPTCHQPHALTGQPDQLRNPLYSTNDYYLTTTSVFTNSYNPNINLCAQCHNHRGASWTNSGRPPHESPQYNILLGSVGELDSGAAQFDPGYHALFITNQCVGCHMQSSPQTLGSPAVTGHQFTINSYAACAGCHGSAITASNSVVFWSGYISNRVIALRDSLNQWAIAKAPAILGTTQYGPRAWEYTIPGALSPEPGPGPNAAQQKLIMQASPNIQKARFDLYLMFYDGSFGVHNPFFSLTLLDTAQAWVNQELGP